MTKLKQNFQNSPPQNFNTWLSSMSFLLGEISTVEISTMIVDEIIEDVFLPYEVYQAIYSISPIYLTESGIAPSLSDRYLQLRRQLELQYALLLINENSPLYNSQLVAEVKRDLPLLAQETTSWENLPCRLPPPINYEHSSENVLLYQLLAEPNFKTILRQLGSLKTSLDNRNLRLSDSENKQKAIASNIIYAQTLIQLDGKIIHRYASEIIEHPQQKAILKLHQKGIEAGEKQWHKLFKFVIGIMQRQQKLQKYPTLNDSES